MYFYGQDDLSSQDADVYSYNCGAPPKPLDLLVVEADCHWLDETALQCCLIQVINALWLLPPNPSAPLSKKKRIVPLLTSAASWVVVRMGSLPEKPPSVITGLLVARMMESAS